MWKWMGLLGGLGLVVIATTAGCKATRAGYESAPYTVVQHDGRFEVRQYPALRVVETPRAADSSDGEFNRLFRFITGDNSAKEKIAMTTPVFMEGSATNATMAFVLPSEFLIQPVPQPNDPRVSIREIPAGEFAVFRYSGGRSPKKEAEAEEELVTWVKTQSRSPQGGPIFGYFDPPWTPAFLRRNEVMLRLAPAASGPHP